MIPALLAPMAAKFAATRLGSALGKVPRWLWIALAIVFVMLAVAIWHGRKVKAFGEERFKAGYAEAVQDGKQAAAKLETEAARATTTIRRNTDEEVGRIARRSDDLRLRGPGRAVCPAPAAAASGPKPPGGAADAGVDRLPGAERPELAAVPYQELVQRSATADANRAEVLAYRQAWQELTRLYDETRAKADAAAGR